MIHPTAVVDRHAELDSSVEVGPYAVIGPKVKIGPRTRVGPHAVIEGDTTMGADNVVFQLAAIGAIPQDLKYAGEPTRVEIGDNNTIREYVTISRGTAGGGGVTRLGDDCLIMAYTHIGHDSQIGNGCILANSATLAGHVIVEDYAVVGALCPVHQFCRIGRHAYIGGGTTITQDVLPYSLTSARRETHAYGLNKIGLERRGFSLEQLKHLQHAYRLLLASKLNTTQAVEKLRQQASPSCEVDYLISFIAASERGVLK